MHRARLGRLEFATAEPKANLTGVDDVAVVYEATGLHTKQAPVEVGGSGWVGNRCPDGWDDVSVVGLGQVRLVRVGFVDVPDKPPRITDEVGFRRATPREQREAAAGEFGFGLVQVVHEEFENDPRLRTGVEEELERSFGDEPEVVLGRPQPERLLKEGTGHRGLFHDEAHARTGTHLEQLML
jgi:hypothetical protein